MPTISRARLFNKLNESTYKAFESATTLCKLRGNQYVDWVHCLAQLLQHTDNDVACIIKAAGLSESKISSDLTASLERMPRSSDPVTDFSRGLMCGLEAAWVYASVEYGASQVRSGYLLLAALTDNTLRKQVGQVSTELLKLEPGELSEQFAHWVRGSTEGNIRQPASNCNSPQVSLPAGRALERYTVDMTAQARAGNFDAIVGREGEIAKLIDVLMRRRQNNPVLTGEAGVGKTAVVEGFAQRIAQGQVPQALKDVKLLSLDIGLLQAGASMKGEFEQRLREVVDQVQGSLTPIILFIDEIHTLVGAGGQAGTGDAANLLKPALARGTLRTIGATTYTEYKLHIEKDPALGRRFQVVNVQEPTQAQAKQMLQAIVASLESHHRVLVRPSAIEAAVSLSSRYLPDRQLPDKAVSLLDTACARVALSQVSTPPVIDKLRATCKVLRDSLASLHREAALGEQVSEAINTLGDELSVLIKQLAEEEARWEAGRKGLAELPLPDAVFQPMGKNEDSSLSEATEPSSESHHAFAAQANSNETYSQKRKQLFQAQGEHPLLFADVDERVVADVLAGWTGIPISTMVANELELILNLPSLLAKRVVGQDHALELIAKRIQTSRAGLDNPDKPVGVFMLAGTSGVGKTETALALADMLYGGRSGLITINMSEYQEPHSIAGLKGSPPGYVGYGEGGVLTEAVRRKPHSVVLLDEMEKAHPDVHELFFQVFDKGWMEDGEGRLIDFRNTLILATTNVGTDTLMGLCMEAAEMPSIHTLSDAIAPELQASFSAALMGRMITIPYYPLSHQVILNIIELQLNRMVNRLYEKHKIHLTFTSSVAEHVAKRCNSSHSGARLAQAILSNSVLPDMSRRILTAILEGRDIQAISVDIVDGEFHYDFT